MGLCSKPQWGSLQLSPNLLAGFKGNATWKINGERKQRKGKEKSVRGEKVGREEVMGAQVAIDVPGSYQR